MREKPSITRNFQPRIARMITNKRTEMGGLLVIFTVMNFKMTGFQPDSQGSSIRETLIYSSATAIPY